MAATLPLSAAQAPAAGMVVRLRVTLADGARTTVHVAAYDTATTELRVALLGGQQQLQAWCAVTGHTDAIVGGFFVRPDGAPLGEVRTRGIRRRHVPFASPWDRVRACVHVEGGTARIARRGELPADPRGDLLQAGPLLVRDSQPVYRRADDPEGFRLGAFQFDSDISDGRYPRAALGLAPGRLLAVAVDGRGVHDAGLTLEELGALLAGLGATDALNLDGGGSTSLVCGGRLRNRPRAARGVPEPGGRPITTALLFVPR
jgi:Phosphodiester glycosidase